MPAANGYDRLIATGTGPNTRRYRIVRATDDALVVEFRTDGINGKTADETAEANLADFSDRNAGEFLLFRDDLLVAVGCDGILFSYRPDNPAYIRRGLAA